MYLSCQRVAVAAVVKDASAFTVPSGTTYVELQADTQNVRYTMDGTTTPSDTLPLGMLFLTTQPPRQFSIEDFQNIKFIQDVGGTAALNAHFYTGRDI